MSPGDGDDPSEAGHAYIVELGPGGLSALMEKVIASLTGFQQLNAAEREDVATEAIFQAVSRKQFDPGKEPDAYIKKIARNMALQKVKKLTRDGRSVLMDNADLNALPYAAGDAGQDEAEQDQDLVARVSQAITGISSERAREVTRRRAFGESTAEVAASLGISEQQVYTQYSRGRRSVREAPEVSPFVRAAYVPDRKGLAKDSE
ncbi:sigma-70 family RNA polymerase sigma factor [Streptomyces rubiginosohelvolus]|uniref:RNA polymerase sigma factor n=1 Tax=Streptomyces rubiginosohelvolus TaxID=67362 RepID=UPI0033BFFF35